MIPKIIHYCWLSGDEFPPLIKKCINTWKTKLPDYKIICWDTKRFDVNSVNWVKESFEARKYAFASDYIRYYALYNYGGIYLDSDVEIIKNFDNLLNNHSFIGYENVSGLLEPAIIGAEKGTAWCKYLMRYYENKCYSESTPAIAPLIINNIFKAQFKDFPIGPVMEETLIANNTIRLCPAVYFSPIKMDKDKNYQKNKNISIDLRNNPNTYCIHRFNGSWVSPFRKKIYDLINRFIGMEKVNQLRNRLFNR